MKSFLTIALLSITNFGFSQNNVELVDYKEIYKNSNDSLMQFFMSSKGDNYGILQLIMNKEDIKKVSPEGLNNLHYACRFGHAETAKLLLNVGIDVNVTSLHRRMVPLHFAILSGNKNLLIELIKYGANVNAQDTEGLTPLHYAVLMNDTNMLKILIDAKANIHLKASNELNPILYSVLMNKKTNNILFITKCKS
jgi:ankyrin repeat protein